jgi:hypothetical protein
LDTLQIFDYTFNFSLGIEDILPPLLVHLA